MQDAGIKLTSVASALLTKSGRAIVEALLAGQADPDALAELARGRRRAKIPALREALAGRFRVAHHGLLVAPMLAHVGLGVVDQTHQRSLRRDLGQQAQSGKSDRNRSGALPTVSRMPPHRVLLGFRQLAEVVEHRRAQLMQHRVRQLQFGLHAGDPSYPTARGLASAIVQQRGLADPGLTTDDQCAARAVADTVQQTIEYLALA